jgi:hypothetical protein
MLVNYWPFFIVTAVKTSNLTIIDQINKFVWLLWDMNNSFVDGGTGDGGDDIDAMMSA